MHSATSMCTVPETGALVITTLTAVPFSRTDQCDTGTAAPPPPSEFSVLLGSTSSAYDTQSIDPNSKSAEKSRTNERTGPLFPLSWLLPCGAGWVAICGCGGCMAYSLYCLGCCSPVIYRWDWEKPVSGCR